ncbi:MAG: helix-turn-helix domain-containing protein [Planctomycetota bacterium]
MDWSIPRHLRRTRFVHSGRRYGDVWQDLLVGIDRSHPGPPGGDGLDLGGSNGFIHLLLQGGAGLRTDAGSVRLRPGDFAVHDPAHPSGVPQADRADTIMAVWRLDAGLVEHARALGLWPDDMRVGRAPLRPDLVQEFERLLHVVQAHARGVGTWPLPAMLQWAGRLRAAAIAAIEPSWLTQARELLRQDLPVTTVAARCYQGVNAFRRAFIDATGCSPKTWAVRDRCERAAAALLEGASVSAVASRFGYRDASRFSRQFRLHMGAAPRAWLREQGG